MYKIELNTLSLKHTPYIKFFFFLLKHGTVDIDKGHYMTKC